MTSPEILFGLIGLMIGAAISWLVLGRRADMLATRLEERERSEKDVEQKLQTFADTALRTSQKQFLDMAGSSFKEQMQPVDATFEQFRKKVEAIEKTRTEDRTAMLEQIRQTQNMLNQTRTATSQLTNALSAPKGAGNWGEESLHNLLELAGASDFCDFEEQVHIAGNDDRKTARPDVLMRMPGGRKLAIDSKVSLDHYRLAANTDNESERKAHLTNHAQKIKIHVRTLAGREYWKIDEALDFVALFIPGDHFWTAALEQDRSLFDASAALRVIIVTPSTLIALAKTIAYGWRQEDIARNAQAIAELGKTMHERLNTCLGYIAKMGGQLGQTNKSYNDMIGSLESRVIPQVRKFEELGASSGKPLPELQPVDTALRAPALPLEPASETSLNDGAASGTQAS